MVFRGVDDEDEPVRNLFVSAYGYHILGLGLDLPPCIDFYTHQKCGGLYKAKLDGKNFPKLEPLVTHETIVPGVAGNHKFARFGEGLSYDGKAVAFWASWGDEVYEFDQCCPDHGNKDRMDFCNGLDPLSIDGTAEPIGCWYQKLSIPQHQGIFVYRDGDLHLVKEAHIDADGIGSYFLQWNYSGKPPSAGGGSDGGHDGRMLDEDSDAAGKRYAVISIKSISFYMS